MNKLTSQQWKMIYLGAMVALLVPVIWLGLPASSTGENAQGAAAGGQLARLRHQYDLGETNLGDVDPASATMNLVLLGMRGVATNLLWLEHEEFKRTKQWAQMKAAANSIILLQPHFLQVWRYQGWDLAYNVSAEWDAVPDRYYWVKEGGKFTMTGATRNSRHPELFWETGRILGQKVGRSDEWAYFRKYFKQDPEKDDAGEFVHKGPDPAFNRDPQGSMKDDNYLCAKEWYFEANRVDKTEEPQHIMWRVLFRNYPARSQFDYADAMQREGTFGEVTRAAWAESYEDWTEKYRNGLPGFGREEFVEVGVGTYYLEANTDEDLQALVDKDEGRFTLEQKKRNIQSARQTSNYPFWRLKAQCEREPNTVEAHREIYDGQQLFKQGKHRAAIARLESGMAKYATMLQTYGELQFEDMSMEEGLMAVLYWKYSLQLLGLPVPETYALKELEEVNKGRLDEIQRRFRLDNNIQTP